MGAACILVVEVIIKQMKIFIGADHAGFKLKESLKRWLESTGYNCEDVGNLSFEPVDDYPDFSYRMAAAVTLNPTSRGVMICGSSLGACIVANKVRGIRAVSVHNVKQAKLSRQHNDANVLCLAGGHLKEGGHGVGLPLSLAKKIVTAWLKEPFSRAGRHRRRVNQIRAIERKNLL